MAEGSILEEDFKGYDFRHNFVYSDMYGYMYVAWQEVDGDKMLLQGLHFESSFSPYSDDSYFTYDAMKEWRIPLTQFIDGVKSGSFKEVTKEEFTDMMTEACNSVLGDFNKQLENLIKSKMQEKKTKICSYCGKEITDGEEYVVMDGGELYHTGCLDRKELNGSGLMVIMAAISAAISIAIVFFAL